MKKSIDNKQIAAINANLANHWDKFQSIANATGATEVETTASLTDYPEHIGHALAYFDNYEQVQELARMYDCSVVLLKQRDGAHLWHVVGPYLEDHALDRMADYDDDPNFNIYTSEEEVNDERASILDEIRADHDENDPDDREDMQEAIDNANDHYDRLLAAVKLCNDNQFVVTSVEGAEYPEIVGKYVMNYHDEDVTAYAIGLVDND